MQHSRRDFTRNIGTATVGCLVGCRLSVAQRTYTVRVGDTLGHIALRHGTSAETLRQTNNLQSDLIRVGQKLKLPSDSTLSETTAANASNLYVVKKGDTLGSIALSHGIQVAELKKANNLSGDLIRIGQKLNIPTGVRSEDLLKNVRAETAQIQVRRNNWERIIVHHSAIKYGNAEIYDRAHRKRGMQNGLAYHFVIGNGIDSGDGQIEVGPRWKKQLLGGHVKSYQINLTAIGICLVGNFQETHPTRRQLEAFTQLMDWLQAHALGKKVKFAGHRDMRGEQTICPGKNFPLAAMHARYD